MPNKIACLFFALGVLAGCATDRARTQAEGTAVGAGAGAGLGALMGYIIGGEDGAKKGAIIGGGVGAIGGLLVGTHVANQKEKFANTENYLDAVIANAKNVNQEIKLYNESLVKKIDQLDTKTRSLVREYNRRAVDVSVLRQQESTINGELSEAVKQLRRVNDEIKIQKDVLTRETNSKDIKSNDQRFTIMKEQIGDLERNKSELQQDISKLVSIKTRVAV